MDKRLVTWFWFGEREIELCHGQREHGFNKVLARKLREAADVIENTPLDLTEAGNVFGSMGTPIGYFEKKDEAKRYTR